MRALVFLLLAACATASEEPCVSRLDAARAVCDALCKREARCPAIASSACVDDCAAIVCPGAACLGYVSDEERLDACVVAIGELTCAPSPLPDACIGVLL